MKCFAHLLTRMVRRKGDMARMGSFVKKEFLLILRDKRTMLILIVLPIVMILIFGFAISNEIENIDVAYYAHEENSDITQVMNKIWSNEAFNNAGRCGSIQDASNALLAGQVDIVVYFDENFGNPPLGGKKCSVELLVDACDPNTATSSAAIVNTIISQYYAEKTDSAAPIDAHTRLLYNPTMDSSYNFVPGLMGLILMLICAMMTSIAIVREKETGTMEVLLVSPTRAWMILLAKVIPYFTVSCFNLATILLLSIYVLGVPVAGSLGGLLLSCMLYILLALSIGLFISTVMKTQVTAILMSIIMILLPTILLSGMIYPCENLPWPLQYLSMIVPARWFISIVKKLMIEGLPFSAVLHEFVVIFIMLVAMLALSVKKFNDRLD